MLPRIYMSSSPSFEPVCESPENDLSELLGPALSAALQKKGYTELTPVQLAVLEPANVGRELRISSQTGSGKTLAIGFALREMLTASSAQASPQAAGAVSIRTLGSKVIAASGAPRSSPAFATISMGGSG